MLTERARMRVGLLVAVGMAITVHAQTNEVTGAESLLRRAYLSLVQAELARAEQRMADAVSAYKAALGFYGRVQADYPGWHGDVVGYRVADCSNAIAELEAPGLKGGKPVAGVGSGTNAEDRLMFIVQELKAARGWLGAEGGAGRLRVMERELDVARGERDQAVKREQAAVRQAARLEARLRRYEKGEAVAKTNALVVLPATIRADAARLMDEGQYDKAIGLLREGYEVLPDRQDFEILAAVAACRAGRFQQATAMLKPYDVKHPVNADALLTLGMAWMGQGKIGEARVATEKALLINPKSAEAHYNMAQIFLTLTPADPVSAEKHYRRALELGMEADREFENSLRMALIVSRLRTRAAK